MQWNKVHFIGIGGVGMSATAKLLQDLGVEVSGSDENVYPPISDFLREQKFELKTPYAKANIPADADAIVIGKNAKLVPGSNPEVAAAMQSGKTIVSFPEVLSELSRGKETIVVAGSYGKSTSTALLAHCLDSIGKDPSFFIGAVPLKSKVSAKIGTSNIFLLEGDEYPSSNTDIRSKFLHYHPQDLLITPLAHDHFNIFPTPKDYLKPFKELVVLPPKDAAVVVCIEGPMSKEFLLNINRPVITYGVYEGDFTAADIAWGEKTSFDIMRKDKKIVRVEMTQLGEHNIQNIVGVAALLFTKGFVTPEEFASAIASFNGIERRLNKKSDKTLIPIYEGFGSSYEKMKSALAAMKQHFPDRRLLVVFEPSTIGWRRRNALAQYEDVFNGASEVYIFNPPNDGKETQLSIKEIADRVAASGVPAFAAQTEAEVLGLLQSKLQVNDCVLLSSSGAMGGLTESIPELAEQKFPS